MVLIIGCQLQAQFFFLLIRSPECLLVPRKNQEIPGKFRAGEQRLQHIVQLLRILRQSCIKDHRLGMAVIQRTGARSLALCQQAFRITIRDRQHRHKIPGFQLLGGAAGESQQNPARDKPRCSQMPSIIQSPDFLCPLFCSFPHETAPFLSVFLPIHRTITRNATLTGTATKLFQIT